ncbi:hypothetical protein HYZ97_04560 [Candidatus Pacearchaeota archaeon]|nr:hypothetical protein [Candidatus Pacearchaeota archaeon]
MKTLVMSLGGSVIIPDKINFLLLEKLKKTLSKYYRTHRFVIVTGGGAIARAYINALAHEHKNEYQISHAGIRATRMNALFLMQFFGKEANAILPRNMKEVKQALKKNKVVICGALRFVPHSTSDSTAARLAHYLKTDFINITNVPGLYTENPLTNKKAHLIPYETWIAFEKRARAIPFKAGEHFVLDQRAAILIRKHRIRTFIIGPKMRNLEYLLKGKRFTGTKIAA